MLPPTSRLPPIKHIATCPINTLEDALGYLRLVYIPPVRGTRQRRFRCNGTSNTTLETSTADRDTDTVEELRNDAFERAYAIKWLTSVVARCGESLDEDEEGDGDVVNDEGREGEGELDVSNHGLFSESTSTSTSTPPTRGSLLVESAASLLAICAGTSAAGVITRTLVFTVPASVAAAAADAGTRTFAEVPSISVTLTDIPLDNQDYGSVGAQTWGGACVMSEMIAENPSAFGLGRLFPSSFEIPTKLHSLRLLELGAGTGLVSITIGKLAELSDSITESRRANQDVRIVATDYYPSVLDNLAHNVRANFPSSTSKTPTHAHTDLISTYSLDWSTFPALPSEPTNPLFEAPFDVVYGADIIYEALHATWIKDCLRKLLRKPMTTGLQLGEGDAGAPECEDEDPVFHLIIPLRSTHTVESSTIEQVFPSRIGSISSAEDAVEIDLDLVIKHKEIIVCDSETGEEVDYAYYKIGWGRT